MNKSKLAIGLGVTALAGAVAYYFTTVRKTNTNVQQTIAEINTALEKTQIKPSKYEGKFIRAVGTAPIYFVQNGMKRWAPNFDVLRKIGYDKKSELLIPIVEVDAIPTGAQLSGLGQISFNLLK